MDFGNVNTFNVQMNKISGNLLPMVADGSSFPILWQIYSALTWLLELIHTVTLIPGCLLVPKEKALKDGLIGIAVTFEVTFLVVRIHAHRRLMHQLIQKLNEILRLEDEMMRNIATETIKPLETPMKFFWLSGLASIVLWSSASLLSILGKDIFYYTDFRMPVAYGKEPVSTNIFVVGSLVIMGSNIFIFTKKVAVDTYVIHLILIVTVQYRYIALKLSTILRAETSRNDRNNLTDKENADSKVDRSMVKQIRAVCRHHNSIVQ